MTTAVQAAPLFKQAVAMAAGIDKTCTAHGRAVAELQARFDAAAARHEVSSLTLYLKALPALIDRIESCLDSCVPFQHTVAEIEEDEAFVQSHLAELGKLTSLVDGARARSTAQFKACRTMKASGLRRLAELTQSLDRAERLLASHDRWVNDMKRAIPPAAAKADAVLAAAKEAAASRDAKALVAAKKAFAALHADELLEFPADLEGRIASSLEQMSVIAADKGPGAAVAAELKATLDAKAAMSAALARIAAARQALVMLEVAAVDVRKAVKLLGLDPAVEPKLAKALAGPAGQRDKSLDALARELGLEIGGKAMHEKLERAHLL